jgi:hypothetical protein
MVLEIKFESDMSLTVVRSQWTTAGPKFETTVRNFAVKVPVSRTAVKADPEPETQLLVKFN